MERSNKNVTNAETLTSERERNLAKENVETQQANINDDNMQDLDDQQSSEKDIVRPEDISNAPTKKCLENVGVCCNGISNRIETENLGNNEVNALYKQLQDKFSRLETTQEEIFEFLLISDKLKNTYQEDFSKAEEYHDKFCKICSLLEASQEKTILVPLENISVERAKVQAPKT
ncbi:putative RNA-directed DNA polymerase from transposon X-element [Trichonephila clavipes]|nr:putative RNA-directed DNA polymerase from transposon X-element [Trichonephila clavipes]